MIFGVCNPEKIWHQQLVQLPTSPVYCSHFTLGNPKKSFTTVLFIHTSDYLSFQKKMPLPTTLKMSSHYCVKCPTFSSDWRYVIFLQTSVALKKSRLWCVANGMSRKQRYSKCSKWPPSARIHASSLFATDQLYRAPCFVEIQPMSQQNASATRPYRGLMVLDTREKWKICALFTSCSHSPVEIHMCMSQYNEHERRY